MGDCGCTKCSKLVFISGFVICECGNWVIDFINFKHLLKKRLTGDEEVVVDLMKKDSKKNLPLFFKIFLEGFDRESSDFLSFIGLMEILKEDMNSHKHERFRLIFDG